MALIKLPLAQSPTLIVVCKGRAGAACTVGVSSIRVRVNIRLKVRVKPKIRAIMGRVIVCIVRPLLGVSLLMG